MSVLVIVVHPDPDSFTHRIADRIVTTLEAQGRPVVWVDLYAAGFSAAMSPAEIGAYQSENPVLDPLVMDQISHISSCETLVFVYPTWWSGLPAVLKGWLDRVMVPGVAFRFNEQGKVLPALTHVKRIVGVSTYETRWLSTKTVNDNGRRKLLRAMRLSTGLTTRAGWLSFHDVNVKTPEECARFLDRVERLATRL